MDARAFVIRRSDNVATLLDDTSSGALALVGETEKPSVVALEPIARGHKIALSDLRRGDPVVKFGAAIGQATRAIPRGAWVHLHNLSSDLDERSASFDLISGAPTDNDEAYA